MRTHDLPRLPCQPLLAASGMTFHEILRAARIPHSGRIWKQAAGPGFTPETADRLAVACGLTAGEVWGDLWWNLPDGACGAAS